MENSYFDEKRARRGIGKNFLIFSFVISVIVGLAIGFGAFKYFTYGNLSPLQKFYFGQYAKSYVTKAVFSRGKYRVLMFQAIDRKTKKKDWVPCIESHLVAKTDENGNVLYDQNKNPMFFIKNEVLHEKNSYMFYPEPLEHRRVYDFFSQNIYQSDFLEFFYLGGGGALISFAFVFTGLFAFRQKRLRKILEGKYQRGTRLLSPQEYVREMKDKADGLGITILTVE